MTQGQHSLPQPLKWLVVAILSLALILALVAQLPRLERAADDSFGTTIVLQKKVQDDAAKSDNPGKSQDADLVFDTLLAAAVFARVSLSLVFSTTHHLAASYLAAFINAPPRAPPVSALV